MSKGTPAVLAVCLLAGAALAEQPTLVLTDPRAQVVSTWSAGCATSAASEVSTAAPRLWGGVEYLLWWTSRPHVPALATTGNPLDPTPGALGQPGTRLLFGDGRVDLGTHSGLRATVGGWIDEGGRFGLESSFLYLERKEAGFSSASDASGNPPVYVPLFRADLGSEGSFTISSPQAFPGLLTGRLNIQLTSRFWGADVTGVANVLRDDAWQLDLLAGFRYLDLLENLTVAATGLEDPTFGVEQNTRDQFHTRNQFYGGQGGFRLGARMGGFTGMAKVLLAMGSTYQSVAINGFSTQSGPGVPNGTFRGGIFAQPTNITRVPTNTFTVVPQVGLSLGYELVDGVSVFGGYDFLYWGRVVRPGDQVDRSVNLSQQFGGDLAGIARPARLYDRTEFLAHGLSVGLFVRY